MMIECPKCGFRQPDDQFCASCGINIKTYVHNHVTAAPSPSPQKKLLWTMVLLGVLVLGLGWSWTHFFKQKEFNQTLTTTERTGAEFESLLSQQKLLKQVPQEAPQAQEPLSPSAVKPAPDESPAPVTVQETPPSAPRSLAPTSNNGELRQIEALYFEVPSELLPMAISRAHNYKAYREVSMGILDRNEKDVTPLINNLLRLRKPQSMAQNASTGKVTAQLSQYSRPANGTIDIGITLVAEVKYLNDNEAEVKLQFGQNFSKLLNEQGGGELLPAVVTLKRGQTLLFIGFLPRREFTPAEAQFFQRQAILSTALSPAFQSGQNEFAILLDVFKK